MKLKYYLRGLGIGILVTAALFLSGTKQTRPMSDAEIIAKAKELGMIESPVLAELESTSEEEISVEETSEELLTTTDEETVQETITEEESTETQSTVEETTVEETTIEESSVEESTIEESEEETSEEESSEEPSQAGETIHVVVNGGEGSDTVSRRLQELGLVDDAGAYDKYLMQNGYDRRIAAGNHYIPMGASWEEIAKLLCSRQ